MSRKKILLVTYLTLVSYVLTFSSYHAMFYNKTVSSILNYVQTKARVLIRSYKLFVSYLIEKLRLLCNRLSQLYYRFQYVLRNLLIVYALCIVLISKVYAKWNLNDTILDLYTIKHSNKYGTYIKYMVMTCTAGAIATAILCMNYALKKTPIQPTEILTEKPVKTPKTKTVSFKEQIDFIEPKQQNLNKGHPNKSILSVVDRKLYFTIHVLPHCMKEGKVAYLDYLYTHHSYFDNLLNYTEFSKIEAKCSNYLATNFFRGNLDRLWHVNLISVLFLPLLADTLNYRQRGWIKPTHLWARTCPNPRIEIDEFSSNTYCKISTELLEIISKPTCKGKIKTTLNTKKTENQLFKHLELSVEQIQSDSALEHIAVDVIPAQILILEKVLNLDSFILYCYKAMCPSFLESIDHTPTTLNKIYKERVLKGMLTGLYTTSNGYNGLNLTLESQFYQNEFNYALQYSAILKGIRIIRETLDRLNLNYTKLYHELDQIKKQEHSLTNSKICLTEIMLEITKLKLASVV